MTDLMTSLHAVPRQKFLKNRSWGAAVGVGWMILICLMCLSAQWAAPFDPNAINLADRLHPPVLFGGDMSHLLGTDNLGRDVFSRLLYAGQTSLLLALFASAISALLGTTIGFVASFFRGIVDEAILALIDFQAAVPFFLIALGVIAAFGATTETVLALLCLYGWERYARLARAMAMTISGRSFVTAAKLYGASPSRIYLRHILPNIRSSLFVNLALTFSEVILLESSLSFLGLGVQPPDASLGSMMSAGRSYLVDAWWMAVAPGVGIFLTTLAMTIVGDALVHGDKFERR